MIQIITFITNLFVFIAQSIILFIGTIIFGKLPKISIFHLAVKLNKTNDWGFKLFKSIFNDEFYQENYSKKPLSDIEKHEIFLEILDSKVNKNEQLKYELKIKDVPILHLDKKIGNQTLYQILTKRENE